MNPIIALAIIIAMTLNSTPASAKMKNKFDMKAYLIRKKSAPGGAVEYIGENKSRFTEFDGGGQIIQREFEPSGLYIIYREFSMDGVLKREVKLARLGGESAEIGEWKSFSDSGAAEKTEDYGKEFKISYERVIEICKARKIDLSARLSRLGRSPIGSPPLWYVQWSEGKEGPWLNHSPVLSGPTVAIRHITIDGVTGEVKALPDSAYLDN